MKLFAKGQGAIIKIISLAIGLTVGLVLIAKVQLERNYDNCTVDKERVYELHEAFQRQGEEMKEYPATPGGIAPVLVQNIPEIEVGTRYTGQFEEEKLTLENGSRHYFQQAMFADSCFFDIFETKVIQGDARKILSSAGQCLISERLYKKMGDEVVGKTFCFASAPDKPMTIAGVFEDYPENSSFSKFDILMSMPSTGTYTWDGTQNLMGNDRYHSFVRLREHSDLKKVRQEIDELMKRVLPWEDLKNVGLTDGGFLLVSVVGQRIQDTSVRTTCIILAIVALVMLFTAVMNYILVVISSLVGRARQVAVRKVYGAPRASFYRSTFSEASTHLLTALAITALLLYIGQDIVRSLLGVSVTTLFSQQTAIVVIAVCLLVLLCCGLLPGFIYARIPLIYAYRIFSENKRVWKLSLLAFQFVLSTMLLCVLTTIYRQYDYLLSKDMGYEYDRVAYVNVEALHGDSIYSLAREIEKLPCVVRTAAAYSLFCHGQSGDNVVMPGDTRELFNCANLFFAESGLVETMGLKIIRGRDFKRVDHKGWIQEMLVDENFARKMKEVAGIDDVVGRQFSHTSLGREYPLTVVGVVKNFTMGSLIYREQRPMMVTNGNVWTHFIMIRLQSITPENIKAVQQRCDKMYPDAELNVKLYKNELADQYTETHNTRDLIMIGCIATLLITLIGLIGYIRDEVQRRTRELAIRKVFGASVSELQSMFVRSIAWIALPTIVIGAILGYALSQLLMEQFPDRTGLPWWTFAGAALVVLLIIMAVVIIQTYRVALKNPVESIKTE